jgi:hypothetical protein
MGFRGYLLWYLVATVDLSGFTVHSIEGGAAMTRKAWRLHTAIATTSILAGFVAMLTVGCTNSGTSGTQQSTSSSATSSPASATGSGTQSDNKSAIASPGQAAAGNSKNAPNDAKEAKPSQPTKAAIQDWIPSGWKLEQQASGDLNGDQRPDTVLQLIETGENPDRPRSLMVLLATASGWQKLAQAPKLLLCASCAGMLGTPDGSHIKLEIKEDILVVSQLAGSRGAVQTTHRFWIDRNSQQFVCIGEDINPYDRANGNAINDSRNFLTGKRIVQHYRGNPNRDGKELVQTQNFQVSKQLQSMKSIDIQSAIGSAPELPPD